MKYESDILEAIHEHALAGFRLGIVSEAEMREYDKGCLPAKAYKEKYAKGKALETVNVEHPELVTA